jgi:hypothetical protein
MSIDAAHGYLGSGVLGISADHYDVEHDDHQSGAGSLHCASCQKDRRVARDTDYKRPEAEEQATE